MKTYRIICEISFIVEAKNKREAIKKVKNWSGAISIYSTSGNMEWEKRKVSPKTIEEIRHYK